MHQLFPSRKRVGQSRADSASTPAVSALEMERRESAEVEFDHDEDYGWVHFGDHDQLHNSQSSKASMTESPPREKSNANSHETEKSAASYTSDDIEKGHASVAAQDSREPLIEGPSAEHVARSNYGDLLTSIAKDRADLKQEMQKSERDRAQFLEHVQSLRQELHDHGSSQALTLREAELKFKEQLQAQGHGLNGLSSKLQSQQEQHEKQTHAALEDLSQKTQGQNTFVLEKTKADFATEVNQLDEKISAVEQRLQSSLDQRLSTQADAVELALDHERLAREYEQRRLAEELQGQKASTKHEIRTALEAERVRSEREMALLQQATTAEIEAEVEHVNINVGDALRSLKAEMDGKRDALAANIDNSIDECKRVEKALQAAASKRNKDIQALEARLKEVEQSHAKDVSVLKELLDKIQEEFSVMNEWNQNLQEELEILREQQQANKTSANRKAKKPENSASSKNKSDRTSHKDQRRASGYDQQPGKSTQSNAPPATEGPRYTEQEHNWRHNFRYHDDFYLQALVIIAVMGTLACM